MGLIYKIFKKYGFEAEVEINKKVYKTKTFSDYYDLFESCTSGYININFSETKFSLHLSNIKWRNHTLTYYLIFLNFQMLAI